MTDMVEDLRPLEQHERTHRPARRRMAMWLLTVLVPMGAVLFVLAVYGWLRTLSMTMAFVQSGSLALLEGPDLSLMDKLLRLDISTTSALIVLLFSLFLVLGGWGLLARRRQAGSWEEFCSHLYGNRLFPENFHAVAIRLGLIGTLVSFVLIAMMLFKEPGTADAPRGVVAEEARRHVQAAQGSQNSLPETSATAGRAVRTETVSAPAQTSFRVFLLLCASLYSTLVGCAFGYFVVPAMETVADIATGRTQVSRRSPELAEREYVSHLEAASRQLAMLTGQTSAVGTATRNLVRCAKAIARAETALAQVRRNATGSLEDLRMLQDIPKSISEATDGLRSVCSEIASAGQTYQLQAKDVNALIDELRRTSSMSVNRLSAAVSEVRNVAESVQMDALQPAGRLLDSVSALAAGLKQNIQSILKLQVDQGGLAKRAADSIASCAEPMAMATRRLTSLADDLARISHSQAGVVEHQLPRQGPPAAAPADLHAVVAELQKCVQDLQAGWTDLNLAMFHGRQQAELGTEAISVVKDRLTLVEPGGSTARRGRRGLLARLFGRRGGGVQAS